MRRNRPKKNSGNGPRRQIHACYDTDFIYRPDEPDVLIYVSHSLKTEFTNEAAAPGAYRVRVLTEEEEYELMGA